MEDYPGFIQYFRPAIQKLKTGLRIALSMHERTVRITEEAYNRLVALRSGGESFSEVILNCCPERHKVKEDMAGAGQPETPPA